MTILALLQPNSATLLPSFPFQFALSCSSPLELKHTASNQSNNSRLRAAPIFSRCFHFSAPLRQCAHGSPSYGGIPGRSGTVSRGACHARCSQGDETASRSSDKSASPGITGDMEGPNKSSSEPQPMLPEVASEAAEEGGGLGDFSLLQTRRFWLGTSVGVLVALGGNLAGVTSSIFNLNPQVSRSFRADLLFPVKGFKRCLDSSQGFEFIYPTTWVGDQRLLYRAVERAERERSLDLPPIQGRPAPKRASSRDPVVAFGPPGSDGELNVSVVVAPVYPGFSLQKIGGPQEAGERILKQFIAPEGSKKVATLLNAQQRMSDDQLYYTLEYSVKGSAFFRHNLAVYTTNAGLLYSLNAQTSESSWRMVQSDLVEIANSFKLLL